MKKRVYLETTVLSYYTARPSRDLVVAAHQEATRELWPRLLAAFETFVSALVFEEARKGNPDQARLRLEAMQAFHMLVVDDESQALAEKIVRERGVPQEYPEDALHIALAAVNGMEIVVTWNFAHLNNPSTRAKVRQIVQQEGYECPEICSPEELLGDD